MKVTDLEMFRSEHFKAADLHEPKLAIIETVTAKAFKRDNGSEEVKPVVHFVGCEQSLVLNVTNTNTIIDITGSPETEDWAGFSIVLFGTTTDYAGRQVECVRVRAPKGQAAEANAKARESLSRRDQTHAGEASGPAGGPEDDTPF